MAAKNPTLRRLVEKGTYNTNVTNQVLKRVNEHQNQYPSKKIFMMGWGYTTQPLPSVAVQALIQTSQNLGKPETYTSYESISGNPALKQGIVEYYLDSSNVNLRPSEIFVNDGAQSALVDVLELFAPHDSIAFQNPWYPAFVEGTLLSGRDSFVELACDEVSNFIPKPPQKKVDIIYLCSPNNPTGAVLEKDDLQAFVDYAQTNNSIIIFDAVYSNFISTPHIPKSIYEIPGAKDCAIEIHSLSKMASFTGVRLGWTIIPDTLNVSDSANGELQKMWTIRNAIKFWGASNLAQQAAIAVLSKKGQQECDAIVSYYMENARLLKQGFEKIGLTCYGGHDNPYIWLKAPHGWQTDFFFQKLLTATGVVGIPGSFFGSKGEGFLRLSTLGDRNEVTQVVKVLSHLNKL